jgi:exopolyphosphatase/guanosine-5'-triphosphate,3'-diphosphate pyrophosphatase
MRGKAKAKNDSPVAVVDIGSNSVRLVVFDRLARAALVLHNEKVTCELGRGLEVTGRLDGRAIERAAESIVRFVDVAASWGAREVVLLATAAVRDAANGPAFAAALAERVGLAVRIVSGAEEARISAMGLVFGAPRADGIMGDLGGGSLELVALAGGRPGRHATLPLGPLRLMDLAGAPTSARAREAIDERLAELDWLGRGRGRTFYAVGGTWRSLARLHMAQADYPLRIIHHYRIGRVQADDICSLVVRLSRPSLRRIAAVSRNRLDALPWGALVLQRILAVVQPKDVVFSANGLREGFLWDRLPPAERRRDPLIAACRDMAERRARMPNQGRPLLRWTAPLFPGEAEGSARLRHAACCLSDVAWAEHPEYRAESAYLAALRFPYNCIAHDERAFLALALLARYGAPADSPIGEVARVLVDDATAQRAHAVGLALRLAHTLMEGTAARLATWSLRLDGRRLALVDGRGAGGPDPGEGARRRLGALAAALGRDPEVAGSSRARVPAR